MKVSYNWLGQYVDLSDISPEELAKQITLTGIEVEGVDQADPIPKLLVGHVKDCQPIEGSDHLQLTQVDVGQADPVQIVCGAPNIKADLKVIVASPGAVLPGDFQIKATTLLGQESAGMICSLEELGFSESVVPKFAEDGIYILPDSAQVGDPAGPYIGLDDAVIDLDVTPNRADALSMRGVAYEVAATLDRPVHFDPVQVQEDENTAQLSVGVESTDDTPFYASRIVEDVKVGDSPLWLQKRLMAAGIRPIDSIVDITNYIMLEYGQPMHAFDYDAVGSNELYVRRAKEGEVLRTLDGKDRDLGPDNLVVTNGSQAIALAGVMGGENTHVTKDTKRIAIEAAIFDPVIVRKTAQKLNLRSESSSRFEKGINEATVIEALDKAAALMRDIGGGKIVSGVVKDRDLTPQDTHVSADLAYINRLSGVDFSQDQVGQILNRLGFSYQVEEGQFDVAIPPRRRDVSIAADLVEEITRIYGYNKVPSTLPKTETIPGQLTPGQRMKRYLKDYMENIGFSQAISYALTKPEKAPRFVFGDLADKQVVSIAHPMSNDRQSLRQSLLSGLLDVAQYNKARQVNSVKLFELGSVFGKDQEEYLEEGRFAGLLTGQVTEASWSQKANQVDFFTAKGIIEQLCQLIGFAAPVSYQANKDRDNMHPGRTADIYIGQDLVGYLGQVHPLLAKEYDLKEVYVFELDLDKLVALDKKEAVYDLVPKYPGTSRDIALLVDESISHQTIVDLIRSNSSDLLKRIHLFDLYKGDNIQEGKQSLAYSLFYQDPAATLKDEKVDQEFDKVKQVLTEELKAEIR